jgi:hypothetical protein
MSHKPIDSPVFFPVSIDYAQKVDQVLTPTDRDRLTQARELVSAIPHRMYQSDSPYLVRDPSSNQVIAVNNPDGSEYWSKERGYSEEAKAEYNESLNHILSEADRELQALLEESGLSAGELLSATLDQYLDLLEHIVANHEFSPGHDRKHLGRDISTTIKIFEDGIANNRCAYLSDIFCGAIGATHNNSVGLVPRYEDFKRYATHADAGALLAGEFYRELFPNCPNLITIISYTIMSHTHGGAPREVGVGADGVVVLPYLDELTTTEEGRLIGFAPWEARGGDRSDMAGSNRQINRHIAATLDGKAEGTNIDPSGALVDLGKSRKDLLIPDPDSADFTLIRHIEGYAISGLKTSIYSQHDSKTIIGQIIRERSQEGTTIAAICRQNLQENDIETALQIDPNRVLVELKAEIAYVCEYPSIERQAEIEAVIDRLWSETVAINPIYVQSWDKVLTYMKEQYRRQLADIKTQAETNATFGHVLDRIVAILDHSGPPVVR